MIKSDIGWLELQDEIHRIKSKLCKTESELEEENAKQKKEIDAKNFIEIALENIELVIFEKENPHQNATPKMPQK